MPPHGSNTYRGLPRQAHRELSNSATTGVVGQWVLEHAVSAPDVPDSCHRQSVTSCAGSSSGRGHPRKSANEHATFGKEQMLERQRAAHAKVAKFVAEGGAATRRCGTAMGEVDKSKKSVSARTILEELFAPGGGWKQAGRQEGGAPSAPPSCSGRSSSQRINARRGELGKAGPSSSIRNLLLGPSSGSGATQKAWKGAPKSTLKRNNSLPSLGPVQEALEEMESDGDAYVCVMPASVRATLAQVAAAEKQEREEGAGGNELLCDWGDKASEGGDGDGREVGEIAQAAATCTCIADGDTHPCRRAQSARGGNGGAQKPASPVDGDAKQNQEHFDGILLDYEIGTEKDRRMSDITFEESLEFIDFDFDERDYE